MKFGGFWKKKPYLCKGRCWLPIMNSHNLHPLKTDTVLCWKSLRGLRCSPENDWVNTVQSYIHKLELYLAKKRLVWNKIQKHCLFFRVWNHFRSEAENCPRVCQIIRICVFSAHSSKTCIHDIYRGALVHMTCVNWTSVRVPLTLYIHIKVLEENMLLSRWCLFQLKHCLF